MSGCISSQNCDTTLGSASIKRTSSFSRSPWWIGGVAKPTPVFTVVRKAAQLSLRAAILALGATDLNHRAAADLAIDDDEVLIEVVRAFGPPVVFDIRGGGGPRHLRYLPADEVLVRDLASPDRDIGVFLSIGLRICR